MCGWVKMMSTAPRPRKGTARFLCWEGLVPALLLLGSLPAGRALAQGPAGGPVNGLPAATAPPPPAPPAPGGGRWRPGRRFAAPAPAPPRRPPARRGGVGDGQRFPAAAPAPAANRAPP